MDNKDPYYHVENYLADDGRYGIAGFVIWHGIIEDIADPLLLGRVRARAIGFHNSDKAKMPRDALPWAQPLIPSSGANSTSRLGRGDWVTGYFLDGFDAQRPVILGKLGGINPKDVNELDRQLIAEPVVVSSSAEDLLRESFAGRDPFRADRSRFAEDRLTPEQKKLLQFQPKPATGVFFKRLDRPDTPALAQELVNGTAVGVANKNRVHVCDISAGMRRAAALTRVAFGQLMQGIRAAVKAILGFLGIKPDSESTRFIELAKKIKRVIDYVQRFIDKITDYGAIIVFYARQVRAMIDWILSLPKALAEMLAGCLNELLNAAAAGFSTLIASAAGVQGNPLKEVTEIIDSSKKLINDTTNLLNVPGQVVEALATPSTKTTQDQALNTLLSFTNGFSTSNTSTRNSQRP